MLRKGKLRSSAGNKSSAFQLGPLLISDNRARRGRTVTDWTRARQSLTGGYNDRCRGVVCANTALTILRAD